MEFTVNIDCGDVYINDEFVSQLCFEPEAIGLAIASWLKERDSRTENSAESAESAN